MLLVAREDLAVDAGLEGKLMEMEDEDEEEWIWANEALVGEVDCCGKGRWWGEDGC